MQMAYTSNNERSLIIEYAGSHATPKPKEKRVGGVHSLSILLEISFLLARSGESYFSESGRHCQSSN